MQLFFRDNCLIPNDAFTLRPTPIQWPPPLSEADTRCQHQGLAYTIPHLLDHTPGTIPPTPGKNMGPDRSDTILPPSLPPGQNDTRVKRYLPANSFAEDSNPLFIGQCERTVTAVADLRGPPVPPPPRPKMFSISCIFWENFGKIVGWRPLLWGILDPPLVSN